MKKSKEILIGIAYGAATILLMIGHTQWNLVFKLAGCVIAMLAVWRIRKKMNAGESASVFTISYIAMIAISTVLLSSLSAGA